MGCADGGYRDLVVCYIGHARLGEMGWLAVLS